MNNSDENFKDENIKKKIKLTLDRDRKLGLSNIKTSVVNGMVTLEGLILTVWHKARAETLTKTVSGVKGIINKIIVTPKKTLIIGSLLKESLMSEKMNRIIKAHLSKIECYLGLIGVSITIILLIIAAILTPGYNPLFNTVSDLGKGISKTLFSIGFVVGGCLGIPFILYMEKTLIEINESVRRIATAVAVICSLSIALVGILPDPEYPTEFMLFHVIVALNAFIGSAAYISLYTYLMLKSKEYKIYHIVIGFSPLVILIILVLSLFNPLVEWMLTINVMLWTIVTSIKLIRC